MTVGIVPVTGKASLKRFIEVPFAVHKNDAFWVPPLRMERKQAFSPSDNEFLRRAEVRFWIATRDGRDVGRISAQIDPLAGTPGMAPVGHFGCLSAIDDPEVFAALLQTAERFLRERGVEHVQGPFSLSINEEMGLLVDGFDAPPMLLMGHDPVYAGARLEELGYGKEKDVYAYLMDTTVPLSRSARGMLFRPAAASVKMRRLDFSNYDNEIRTIVDIYNDAWSGNWGFVPLTESETDEMAKRMRVLLDERLVWFAEVDGEAVAFIVALPNVNEAIRDLDGRLLPFGWAKLLWRLKVKGVGSGRVPLMGVRRHLAGTVIGSALPLQLVGAIWPGAIELGFRWFELSWILEDNLPMRRILERLGAHAYKTYRIYGKTLG
ncbi:MAG: dATP pyrophosphohydrolase [Alphaproteobacteria bacterium HGW-Alphaproteobacteria-5]|nr:MAG: dATP pyrophosphohydrolase [Alphaproteobacteria bacterium HGW-Alphaproteobacteria-5]